MLSVIRFVMKCKLPRYRMWIVLKKTKKNLFLLQLTIEESRSKNMATEAKTLKTKELSLHRDDLV